MTTLYIASKSSNSRLALEAENIIAICFSGPKPEADARAYAYDYAKGREESSFIYAVEVEPLGGYKIQKEVVSFGPTK